MWVVSLEFKAPEHFEICNARLGWYSSDSAWSGLNDDGTLYLRLEVQAGNAWRASRIAFDRLEEDLARGLIPQPHALRVFERNAAEPVPRLVGLTEIAKMLAVSRQRVGQLTRQMCFPIAVAQLAMGPVYTEPSLQSFMRERARKGVRNRRTETSHGGDGKPSLTTAASARLRR